MHYSTYPANTSTMHWTRCMVGSKARIASKLDFSIIHGRLAVFRTQNIQHVSHGYCNFRRFYAICYIYSPDNEIHCPRSEYLSFI